MGTWAAGSFGNDTALDFADELKDFAALCETLVKFGKNTDELDADEASTALAACDLLAVAIGRPPADLPDGPDFSKEEVPDNLLDSAKAIVQRVRETSELAELWSEEDDAEWQAELENLLLRLTPSAPTKAPAREEQPEIPDDFLGHCYLCSGPVIERDGINFEYTMQGGGTLSIHPHRSCIEKLIPGPHWNEDGSPSENTRKRLMKDMGFVV
ncbi:DUF4259 domain-containing protein [Denitrobaculum tricleocarpae]|uniref:DUF4259 domain-containing protein n=1 Tax=Denitrobaculum tricleocarpae TaxID=2591009 RepID=A0A545U2X5_9PROT|nr:DUF4259 domain-containing protein [Denitrobaculum tricleocarpae]TQV83821.1 DUF4259 domain-containing protein [Denitrobaculum tricleocarpae]